MGDKDKGCCSEEPKNDCCSKAPKNDDEESQSKEGCC